MVGQHSAKWNAVHYKTALGILHWMYTHRHEGVVFHRTMDFDPHNCLLGFADADLAGTAPIPTLVQADAISQDACKIAKPRQNVA